jgi:hypothetical protein
MALSPPRAFALGACSVFALAGAFVAGIGVGQHDTHDPARAWEPADHVLECPGPPVAAITAEAIEHSRACADLRDAHAAGRAFDPAPPPASARTTKPPPQSM